MKKNIKIVFLFQLMLVISAKSQMYDFNWLIGNHSAINRDSVYGHTMISFNTQSGHLGYKYLNNRSIDLYVGNSLSISDQAGNFLFSFNGFIIEDSYGKKVSMSDSICYFEECWASSQQSVIIPKPDQDSTYLLFTVHDNWFKPPLSLRGGLVSYIPVKVGNKNKIELTEKKTILTKDTFDVSKISACKHANGRDWWIIIPEDSINSFYTFLVSNSEVIQFFKQKVSSDFRFNGDGMASFSPNGEYYSLTTSSNNIVNPKGSISFYNFDRCTGLLTNFQSKIFCSIQSDDYSLFVSGAFSSDSKLFYACQNDSLFQFTISEDGILGDRLLIDVYDGYLSYLFGNVYGPTKFTQLQLAPDGKIYCNPSWVQTREYGVINKPNIQGKSCDFRQHSLRMPVIKFSSPVFPNYRLGPIDGSICDTLGIDNIPWAWWRFDQDTANFLKFEFTDLSAYEVTEWLWSFGDGNTSATQHPIHKYKDKGVYEVCLIAKNKNGADTLCRTLNIGIASIDTKDNLNKIEVFPNPCDDYFVINVLEYFPERMMMSLIDLNSKEVLSKRLYEGSNPLDLSHLSQGVYLLNIRENNVLVHSEKLMVIHN